MFDAKEYILENVKPYERDILEENDIDWEPLFLPQSDIIINGYDDYIKAKELLGR